MEVFLLSIDAFIKAARDGSRAELVTTANAMVKYPRLHASNIEGMRLEKANLERIRQALNEETPSRETHIAIDRCNTMIRRMGLAIRVREARLQAGLKSVGLSKIMGKNTCFVSNVERCTPLATTRNAEAILQTIHDLRLMRLPYSERTPEPPPAQPVEALVAAAADTTISIQMDSAMELLRLINAVNQSGKANVTGDVTMNLAMTVKV